MEENIFESYWRRIRKQILSVIGGDVEQENFLALNIPVSQRCFRFICIINNPKNAALQNSTLFSSVHCTLCSFECTLFKFSAIQKQSAWPSDNVTTMFFLNFSKQWKQCEKIALLSFFDSWLWTWRTEDKERFILVRQTSKALRLLTDWTGSSKTELCSWSQHGTWIFSQSTEDNPYKKSLPTDTSQLLKSFTLCILLMTWQTWKRN